MQSIQLSPSIVLLGAAELLRQRGWCQRRLKQSTGEMCMLGALAQFTIERGDYSTDAARARSDEAHSKASELLLRAVEAIGYDSHVNFNDADGRTAAQVIEMLERAALG